MKKGNYFTDNIQFGLSKKEAVNSKIEKKQPKGFRKIIYSFAASITITTAFSLPFSLTIFNLN
jgi:hypothetical protein